MYNNTNIACRHHVPEPTYELVNTPTAADDNVNTEKNPSYSVTPGVQDRAV